MHEAKFASVIVGCVTAIIWVSMLVYGINEPISPKAMSLLGVFVPGMAALVPIGIATAVRFGLYSFHFGRCDNPAHYRHDFAQFHNRKGWWYCHRCDRIAKGDGMPEKVMPSHSVTIDECGHQVVGLLTPGETHLFMGSEAACQDYHRRHPE